MEINRRGGVGVRGLKGWKMLSRRFSPIIVIKEENGCEIKCEKVKGQLQTRVTKLETKYGVVKWNGKL